MQIMKLAQKQNTKQKVYNNNNNVIFSICSIKHHIVKGKGKGKGKAIPLQAWTGPEGSRRLRLPDFKTIGT